MNTDTLITFGVSLAVNGEIRPKIQNDFEFYQRVVECHGVADDDWLKIKGHGDNDFFEINPNYFISTFQPKFLEGETVYVPRKSCDATVYGISWHFKREEYIYSLMFDGKKNSRRYFADELEKIMKTS